LLFPVSRYNREARDCGVRRCAGGRGRGRSSLKARGNGRMKKTAECPESLIRQRNARWWGRPPGLRPTSTSAFRLFSRAGHGHPSRSSFFSEVTTHHTSLHFSHRSPAKRVRRPRSQSEDSEARLGRRAEAYLNNTLSTGGALRAQRNEVDMGLSRVAAEGV